MASETGGGTTEPDQSALDAFAGDPETLDNLVKQVIQGGMPA